MAKIKIIKTKAAGAGAPVPPADRNPVPAKAAPDLPAAATPTPAADVVAVLALGEAGEILAARDACRAIFGWEPHILVGQNIRVLLKRGLDNDVGRFLHRHREGKNPTGTSELRVQALRKDGSEFPAQVTTLTWSWDTTAVKKSDTSRLCWTAAFRDLAAEAKSVQPAAPAAHPAGEVASRPPEPGAPEPAATVPSAPVEPARGPESHEPKGERAAERVAEIAGVEPKQLVAEPEHPLATAKPEPAQMKSGPEAGAREPGLRESELRAELDAAREAVGYAEAALREEIAQREKLEERLQNLSNSLRLEQAERSKRFEEELCGLRQERDELNGKLAAEQQGAGESTRRAEELEARLGRNAAEFEHARAELEKLSAERARSETCWREQLDTAHIAKKELEGAWAGAVEQNKRFEEELANLRREHDELNQKLAAEQKAATESNQRAQEVASRLNRNAAAADRARAELEKENAERERADAEWREQLEAAKALKTRLENALAQATERNHRYEGELATLRQEREELNRKLASERQAAGESTRRAEDLDARLTRTTTEFAQARAELEKQTVERARADAAWRDQLETACHSKEELERTWAEAIERNKRIEQELATLRHEHDELIRKEAAQQKAADRARAEWETLNAEHERADVERREQLEAANTLATRLEAALAEATETHRHGDDELAGLRRERDELKNQVASARQNASELQRRVDQNAADLEQITAALEKQHAERERTEARGRELQETAKAQARKLEADWAGAMERNVRFEEELAELRRNRDELAIQLKAAQQASAQTTQRAGELERRLERNSAELKRASAEAERLHSEWEHADAEWQAQLEATKALARKLDAAWSGATERNRRVEAEAAGLRQERAELQGRLTVAQHEAADSKARSDELENRVQRMAAEVERVTRELEKQRAESERLEPARRAPTDSEPAVRRLDSTQPNGHSTLPLEGPTTAKPSARAKGPKLPVPASTAPDPIQSDRGPSTLQRPGQTQQYSFEHPTSTTRPPAQRETSSSKERLQP